MKEDYNEQDRHSPEINEAERLMMVFLEAIDRVVERVLHETASHENNPEPHIQPVLQNGVWRNLHARRLCSRCAGLFAFGGGESLAVLRKGRMR